MSAVVKKQKITKDSSIAAVVACKDCHQVKSRIWDCAWDNSHGVCSSCAAACSRCGQLYCNDCRVVLVFCDSCDAMFCPTCKPRVCVCIVPRVATLFMVDFRSKNHPGRRVSDASKTTTAGGGNSSTTSSRQTSEEGTNQNGLDKQDDQEDLE